MHDMRAYQDEVLAAADQLSATASQTGVDISDYIGVVKITQTVVKESGTAPTHAGKIQESDDNSTFTDVTDGAFTTLTNASGNETIHLDTRALKCYVRHLATLGGTNPVFNQAVVLTGRKQEGGQ